MKKLKHILVLLGLVAFGLLSNPLNAQISEGGIPPSFAYPTLKAQSNAKSSFLVQPNFDVKRQIELDQKEQEESLSVKPLRMGRKLYLNESQGGVNLIRDGEKTILPDGTQIWRLSIKSPGALAIGLYYDKFYIPKGGKLFIYNPNNKEEQLIGAFTEKNSQADGKFATELLLGDELVLEYVSPVKIDNEESMLKGHMPQINIYSIVYGYNNISGSNNLQNNSHIGEAASCMVNVNCSPEGDNWQDQKKGVAKIYYPIDAIYVSWCSGTIVNNTAQDLTPYYLTAFHCIDGTVEWDEMVFYFHFESQGCTYGGVPPTSTKTMVGAELKAASTIYGGAGSDGALLKLTSNIPLDYEVYYNGWDRTNPTVNFDGVGIHHPAGDLKKISTFEGAYSNSSAINWQGGGQTPAHAHWRAPFITTPNGGGGTEGGSSGSPLFNSAGLVVGTLSGGGSDCAPSSSLYGKFWYHWDQGSSEPLAPYLDPIGSGQTTISGTYVVQSAPSAAFGVSSTDIYALESVTYKDYSSMADTWEWTFDGGTPSTFNGKEPPAITYNNPGSFTTTLTINKGTANEDATTRTINVTIKGGTAVTPVANFSLVENILLEEYFTGTTFPPTGWSVDNRGGTSNTWQRGQNTTSPTPDPVSPTFFAYHRWTTDNPADSWLISPSVTIPANGASVDFYCSGGDQYQGNVWTYLYVIDASNNEIELWNNGYLSTEPNYTWAHPSISLDAYVGQTIKLAWRYEGYDGDAAMIDGVVVKSYDPDATVTINVGDYVTAVNLSTGPPVFYEWTFDGGDPVASDKENPDKVRYMSPGTFDVSLWVKNTEGEHTRTFTGAVTVNELVPVADYEASGGYIRRENYGLFIPSGAEIDFKDKSLSYPTSWEWTFGGGTPTTSADQNPTGIKFNTDGEFDFGFKTINGAGSDEIAILKGTKVGYNRDTIWNLAYGEEPAAIYSYSSGYITGTNSNYVTAYAEKFEAPLAPSAITAVKMNILAVGQTSAHTLQVGIAKMGSDGYPGAMIGSAVFPATAINQTSIADNNPVLVEFDAPININEPFFVVVGDPTGPNGDFWSPGYTAAIATTITRGAGAKNTVYWHDYFYYAYNMPPWQELSSAFADFSISMDVAPVLTYTIFDGADVDRLNFKNVDTTIAMVNVKSNIPWKATTDASWIVLTNGSEDGDGTFSISVKNNRRYNARKAFVKVSAGEGMEDYVLVQQSGPAPTDLTATIIDEEKGDVELTWNAPPIAEQNGDIFDDVEDHTSFDLDSPGDVGWTYIDGDGGLPTKISYGGENFPNANIASSFMVYVPSETDPPITHAVFAPHSGEKYFACPKNYSGPTTNDDWLVSPKLSFNSDFKFSFWARSLNAPSYVERIRVAYSTTGNAQTDFTNVVSAGAYENVPAAWTNYEFTIPADAKYVAINCVSASAFMLLVDDLFIGTGEVPQSYSKLSNSYSQGAVKFTEEGPIVKEKRKLTDAEIQTRMNAINTAADEVILLRNETTGESIEVVKKAYSASQKDAAKAKLMKSSELDGFIPQDGTQSALDAEFPVTKLRYDNDKNYDAIVFNSEDNIELEVAIRFTPLDLLKYQGAKMKAVDVFVKNAPSDGITINIRQGDEIVHSQQAAVVSDRWNRVKLTEEIAVDATKDLYVGYAGVQRAKKALPGVDKGPGKAGKSDLISIFGDPFESLYELNPALNFNWNIALLVEDKEGIEDITYKVYRDNSYINEVRDLTYLDEAIATKTACYEVTAFYNGEVESLPSNTSCVTLKTLLEVIADDISRYMGQPNPELTFGITGDFEDGDTEADIKSLFTLSTTATIDSEVGDYPIEISRAAHSKYRFGYHDGILTVMAVPALNEAPTLTATAGKVSITLQWTAVADAVSYNVYREGVQIATAPGTTYTDSGLIPGRQYCYTVKGVSGIGAESDMSNEACATVHSNIETNAFTPYEKDGINDVFMFGAKIEVVNRYGQSIFNGNNGWDGSRKGKELVPPGTYYYKATLTDGRVIRGSVEVVKKK